MGWSRKAKFGIHSGRTLRNWPTRKQCRFGLFSHNGGLNGSDEFVVVKQLFEKQYDGNGSDLNDNQVNNKKFDELFGFDDGIPCTEQNPRRRRGYPSEPVVHSMNKRKRWMLPDLMKEFIEENSLHLQNDEKSTKPLKNKQKQSDELRVIVVERHASAFVSNSTPDCFNVACIEPNSSTSTVKSSTKTHAHVGDLKPKVTTEQSELYYEFLSPYSSKTWPCNREMNCWNRYDCEVSGTKSRKKCKGRRNKHRGQCGGVLDEHEMAYTSPTDIWCEDVSVESSCNQPKVNHLFPIGTYIHNIINKSPKKKKTNSPPRNSTKPTLTQTFKYGKGDAIYIHDTDDSSGETDSNKVDNLNESQNLHISPNKKVNIQMLVNDIKPGNLIQAFGDNYFEGNIYPRKFIIKADLDKVSPTGFPHSSDCSLLFEVSDNENLEKGVVDGKVSFALPKPLTETATDDIEAELLLLGPLSVKTVINVVTESCVQQCIPVQQPNGISFKKTSPKVNKNPIKLIQDICQQKAEVCGVKRAFEYSTMNVPAMNDKTDCFPGTNGHLQVDDSCCAVCLSDTEELHDSGQTRLLQCSHVFCNECWKHYIVSCIHAGQGSISCPSFNCTTILTEPLVFSCTNTELYQRYCRLHYQHTINTNPNLRSCPAPGCHHLAHVSSRKPQSFLPICCDCGEIWCFQCQQGAHWPASCAEAELFRKKHGDYEEFKKSLLDEGRITSVMVKRCPFCHYPIYKNLGCQHMSCRCGNEFCWECLKPWDNHVFPCDKMVKDLEEVVLLDVEGNARYSKYCKVSHLNFLERNRKKMSVFLKTVRKTRSVEKCHKLVAQNNSSASRLVREYVTNGVSDHIETLLHFKYLAHIVLENTAAAMAVAKRTKMVGRLDKNLHTLTFIVERFNEVLLEPIRLTDEHNFKKVCDLLNSGERLIKEIHKLTRANRKIKSIAGL